MPSILILSSVKQSYSEKLNFNKISERNNYDRDSQYYQLL